MTRLKPKELSQSLNACIKIVQATAYAREIKDISEGKSIHQSSNIKNSNPILDENGYLRVGGKLQNASLPYECTHQLVLSPENHFTKLIIFHEHQRILHAATQLLIASLRQRYWITRIQKVIKKCIHSCLTCYKLKASTAHQLMGNLTQRRSLASKTILKYWYRCLRSIHD